MLYGLKQSPRKWNDKLNEFLLQKMNFTRSVNDPTLYWKTRDDGTSYLLIYVDDILIFVPKGSNSLACIKKVLSKEFEMKDMGELKSFLGIEVTQDQEKHMITLSQKGYIDAILEYFS